MEDKPPVFQNPHADGGSFYWQGKTDTETAILLFHGFTATTVEVRPMARLLNDHGYTVSGPLLPGHGVSPEELNHTSFMDWIKSAEAAYQELARVHKNVFVLGESMGGLLTLWLGRMYPEIKGLLVFAPALRIPNLWQSSLVWPFVNFLYKKNIDLSSPWQGFNVIPLRAASQLYALQRRIRHELSKINQPILIFQGKLDKTIDPISSVEVLEGVSSVDKELVWLKESGHVILLEKQINIVRDLCISFIEQKIN